MHHGVHVFIVEPVSLIQLISVMYLCGSNESIPGLYTTRRMMQVIICN